MDAVQSRGRARGRARQERAHFQGGRQPAYFAHHEATAGPWRELYRGLVAAGRVRDLGDAADLGTVNDLMYGTILANQTELASVTGVYNTSTTPSDLPWDTSNYCNAPHVNAAHYTKPNVPGAELVYMNTVIRHHKVRL